MKKLDNDIYGDQNINGKYIYLKRSDTENDMYYIFKIISIINAKYPFKYEIQNCYMMLVPKDAERKAYVYDKYKEIELKYTDEMYEMTYDEWLNTFRVFVKNEGEYVKNLPYKLIQDI